MLVALRSALRRKLRCSGGDGIAKTPEHLRHDAGKVRLIRCSRCSRLRTLSI